MTTVIKKDGRKTPFYIGKILSNLDSVERVFGVNLKNNKENIIKNIQSEITQYKEIESTKILEIIENELAEDPLVLLAFEELKRSEQKNIDQATCLNTQLERFNYKDKNIMNENGNKDSRTAMTQRDLLSGTVSKVLGLKEYPEDVQ